MAPRTIFTLAAHVARQLTKAQVTSETYRCDDADIYGWFLWSCQWKVEHPTPSKHSSSDPSKFSTTTMVVLGTDGNLHHVEAEKRWDGGGVHLPTANRIRGADWHWLSASHRVLSSLSAVEDYWSYLQSKVMAAQIRPLRGITNYPPKIDRYSNGEDMMRKLLYRRLNGIDKHAQDLPRRDPAGAVAATPPGATLRRPGASASAQARPSAQAASEVSPQPLDLRSVAARVVGFLRRR